MPEIAKSPEMPELKTIQYNQTYKMSDMFINDLKRVLADLPYVEAQKFLQRVEDNKRIFSIAALNEFIRDLSYLPYKVVCKLMGVINNKENFLKYFNPITINNQQNN